MSDRKYDRLSERVPSAAATRSAVASTCRDLAVRVRRLRLKYGFSQRALALRMGTSERAIRRIEKRHHNVTIEVLVRLALALDVGVHELLAPALTPASEAEDPATDGRIARARKHDLPQALRRLRFLRTP
jgi:transcriptional regulator with XRE-family HTH domain